MPVTVWVSFGVEFPIIEIFNDAVETEKEMMWGPTRLLRTVTDPSYFLFGKKGKDARIQVESWDSGGGRFYDHWQRRSAVEGPEFGEH